MSSTRQHIALIVAGVALIGGAACTRANAPAQTSTAQPPVSTLVPATPMATPASLLTVVEARDKVQRYAASDVNLPRSVQARPFAVICASEDDRYSPERHTWVIHCGFFDTTQITPITGNALVPFYDQTYLLDDLTNTVHD